MNSEKYYVVNHIRTFQKLTKFSKFDIGQVSDTSLTDSQRDNEFLFSEEISAQFQKQDGHKAI